MKYRHRYLLRYPFRILGMLSHQFLYHFEHWGLIKANRKLQYPPIFIVGLSRSGTTLLYQIIVHHFKVAYFPDFANRFNKAPILATRIALKLYKQYLSNFKSNYGRIKGGLAPSEAGNIWNRWFPTEWSEGYNYTPVGYFNSKTKHILYQTVAGIERLFDAPFINKNVKQSVRIQSLVEIFPKALFIQMKRNPFDNVISILRMRKERSENVNDWYAVMPKEINQLKDKNYLEQICGQVYYIEKNIKKDIAVVGKERLQLVHYEDVCASPKKELDKISAFIGSHGYNLRIKYDVPKSFKKPNYKKDVLRNEEKMIRKILTRYYEKGEIDEFS